MSSVVPVKNKVEISQDFVAFSELIWTLTCTETDFKHKFFTGRPSPRFNDAVTGGQPGGSSQNGGQPGGSSQTGGQNGGQPGGSSQTGGQPGGSSQTGGQPGGAIGIKPTGVSLVFIALTMLPFVIFVH